MFEVGALSHGVDDSIRIDTFHPSLHHNISSVPYPGMFEPFIQQGYQCAILPQPLGFVEPARDIIWLLGQELPQFEYLG